MGANEESSMIFPSKLQLGVVSSPHFAYIYGHNKTSHNSYFTMDLYSLRPLPVPDVRIITSAGITIPAHSSILGAGSLVLENILESRPRKGMGSEKIIHILGVPCDSVVAFLRFLYSFRCSEEEIHEFGVHLLVLSHFFSVPKLKERCRIGLDQRLTIENVVDVLQISKLCDAPDLYLKCMKLVMEEFKGVEMTEGWRFIQNHDPRLELEILQFINDSELRLKQRRKQIAEKSLYLQLSEAMDCLQHIFTEGCIHVGPYDKDPIKKKFPCKNYSTCQGLQQLICHFATCKKKVNGGCSQCKRMWQILRLHSSTCDQSDSCNVPLCRQFKVRSQQDKKRNDIRWRLLVRRVVYAKVTTKLSILLNKRVKKL